MRVAGVDVSAAPVYPIARAGSSRPRLAWLCAALLAVASFFLTRQTVGYDFVAMDDDINIYFNPHLGPPSRASVEWMFTDLTYMRRYVPLGWLAFSTVYEFSGLTPGGYHAANVLFHVVNTLLVFAVVLTVVRAFARPRDPDWTIVAAMLGAALWAVHPLRAETIGWCSGLLYGAAGCAALASTWCYARLVLAEACSHRGLYFTGALIGYAVSVFTYPVALALPLVFLAFDGASPAGRPSRLRREPVRVALEKLALFAPGVAVGICTVVGRFQPSALWPNPPTWETFSLGQRIAQAFSVWASYLWKTVVPVELTVAPTWLFEVRPLEPRFLVSSVVIVGVTLVLAWRRSRWNLLLLWLSYLALLAPLVGFTEHPHFASDRYAYLGSVTFSIAVAIALARLSRPLVAGALAAVLVALASVQVRQLRVWQNTATLTANLIAHSSHLDFTADNYRKWAKFHVNRGEYQAAADVIGEARRVAPKHPWIANLETDLSLPAVSAAASMPAVRPPASLYHEKLALGFARSGRLVEAGEHFAAAWRLFPQAGSLAFNWAVFCATSGEPARAWHLYTVATADAMNDRPAVAARLRLLQLIAEAFDRAGNPRLAAAASQLSVRLAQSEQTRDVTPVVPDASPAR